MMLRCYFSLLFQKASQLDSLESDDWAPAGPSLQQAACFGTGSSREMEAGLEKQSLKRHLVG